MRLRNIKDAKEILEENPYVIEKYNKEVFSNNNKLQIEIGCGRGDFIIGKALNNPNINFIGIEKFDSVLVRAVRKIEEDIPNLRFMRMDAENIDNIFKHVVDILFLNFSDPWPKKRHAKRRLTSKLFLKKYENIFSAKKNIYLKTDNTDLFNYSLETLKDEGYSFLNLTYDLKTGEIENEVETEYERKFRKKGVNIKRVEAIKE